MNERGLPAEGAPACPFVAFEDDRDGRSTAPDHRHRCFAESRPAPRALAHQEAYCLSSAFPVCPTFQDWARREAAAARPAAPAPGQPAREEVPQSRPLPPADREGRHGAGTETPPPVPPRRNAARDWAAPPPWTDEAPGRDDPGRAPGASAGEVGGPAGAGGAAGLAGAAAAWGVDDQDDEEPDVRDIPAVPPRAPARGSSSSRQPAEWGSDSRGLAGSAAHRLAGPDPLEPAPAVPVEDEERWAPHEDDPSRRRRTDADDDPDAAWTAGAGAGAYVAGSATARPPGSRSAAGGRGEARGTGRSDPRREETAGRSDQVRRPTSQDAQELFGPAWERPRRYEAYPTLRTRIGVPGLRSVSRVALYGGALALAAAFLFLFGPRLLGLVGEDGAGAGASPSPAATVAPTPTPEPTEPPPPTPQVYLVKSGDTISKIAKRFGVTVEDLLAANPQIKNPDRINVGDPITIPVATDENGFPEGDGTVDGG